MDNSGDKRALEAEHTPDVESKRLRLTKQNLRQHTKGELAKSRGVTASPTEATGTTTPTTNERLGAELIRNGVVFEHELTQAPADLGAIREALTKERRTPDAALGDWASMQQSMARMETSEWSAEGTVLDYMLCYHVPLSDYIRAHRLHWSKIDSEITAGSAVPVPDLTEAYSWDAYPPDTKDTFPELNPHDAFSMPTFAIEMTATEDLDKAVKQAAYAGAVMTYATIATEEQIGKEDESVYSRTKAITIIISPQSISFYANHAIKDDNDEIEFHQHFIEHVPYMDSLGEWNRAYGILYNAQTIASGLAQLRIEDIKMYFENKAARLEG